MKNAKPAVKTVNGFKVKTNVKAGAGFNNRDSYGSPYGTY